MTATPDPVGTAGSTRPEVSVVLPVHRAEGVVAGAMRRVLAMEGVELELIVVDDASDDATAGVAEAVAAEEPRARVLRRAERGGATRARATGIEAARGELVWQVDVDDDWDPGLLAVLVTALRSADADVAVGRAERIERNGRRTPMEGVDEVTVLSPDDVAVAVLDGTVRGYLWNKVFRRELLGPIEREPLSSQDDFLVVLDALGRARRVVLVPDVLYRYQEQSGSISNSSLLRLGNTATCHEAAVARFGTPEVRRRQPDLVDHFTCWFLLVPVLTTPVHQGWPADRRREVRRRWGRELRWRHVRATLRRDRRRGAQAAALWALGPLFGPVYRSVGRVVGFSIQPASRSAARSSS